MASVEGRVALSYAARGCLFLFLFSGFPLFAHEVRPAYLELHQTGAETYELLWKVPGQGEDLRLGLYVQLPESCSNLTQPRGVFAANAYTERWNVRCAGGLSGGTIRIAGLSATLTYVLVRLERLEGSTEVTRLTPALSSFVVEAAPSRMEIVRTYLFLGIEAHFNRSGPSAVRARFAAAGARLRTTGENRQRVYRSAQRYLGLGHARFCSCSSAAGGSGDRPEHRLCRQRDFPKPRQVRVDKAKSDGASAVARRILFRVVARIGIRGRIERGGIAGRTHPLALLLFSIGVEIGHFGFIAAVLASMPLGRRIIIALRLSPLRLHHLAALRLLPPYAIGGTAMFWLIERIAAF